MYTLVLNAGSSSLRFAVFKDKKITYKGHVDAIGQFHCLFRKYLNNGAEVKKHVRIKNHEEAVVFVLKKLSEDCVVKKLSDINKVGHRVVHGAEEFRKPIKINFLNLKKLEKLSALAPLHNPANIACIKAAKKILWHADHFAVFDTAFHASLPEHAFLYGLPYKLYKKEGIRRYGFHGISHEYVSKQIKASKIISCHIGNGVSVTAIKNGVSVDTSMGFTPLEGPMMGTRSGTIDPAIIFHLVNKKRSLEDIKNILEKESGFKGLSEISSDIRKLRAKASSQGTKRVFDVFCYQTAKIILSFYAAFSGQKPDAIIFTAGIGENADYIRSKICNYIDGATLDEKENKKNAPLISSKKSEIKVYVVKTNEEQAIADIIG